MTYEALAEFLNTSPTAFQAVDNIRTLLEKSGCIALNERDIWRLEPGRSYYCTRNSSSIIAFHIPKEGFAPFKIIAAHSDSPCFKLKPKALRKTADAYASLNVEKYGGMLMSTWLDRPLGIAGRLIVREDGALKTVLVDSKAPCAVIPNVPIHFNREANDGVAYNMQVDMMPVLGAYEGCDPLAFTDVDKDAIADSDLFMYNAEPAVRWGDLFSAPRIDDLECAFCAASAFAEAAHCAQISVLAVMDNEEVGSLSKQGADSTLIAETLARIAMALNVPQQVFEAALAGSFMLSADNGHAVHPNHPEKYDADNRCHINKGVLIKRNANQKYTTDGVSGAVFAEICKKAGVPVQQFVNRSDIPGGSTLGNIANAHVSMNTVDIGLAQWAMHSAYETAGVQDAYYMADAMKAFYETEIDVQKDGLIHIG